MRGMLAKSKAGHDKGKTYLIIKEEEQYVYLADGEKRTLADPKKKNKKHLQPVKRRPEMPDQQGKPVPETDTEVKRIIKLFLKEEQI